MSPRTGHRTGGKEATVSYTYQPRDPRAKLREVSAKWVSAMRVAGHAPNRDVVFERDSPGPEPAHARGFLVDDRRPDAAGSRYLVLEDGDVLRAPEERWLPEPDDQLVTLLAKALADARMGGSGWLADGDGDVERVPDRRGEQLPHQGPERRSRG
jgi:hypothetical protein